MKSKKITTSELTELALGKTSKDETLRLLDALENDKNASREFEFVLDVLTYVKGEGNDLFLHSPRIPASREAREPAAGLMSRWIQKVVFPAFAVVCLLLLTLVRWESQVHMSYVNRINARLMDIGAVRGSESFENSRLDALLNEKRYIEAIAYLEHSLRVSPERPQNVLFEYQLGICYVQVGKSEVLGGLATLDERNARIALVHFERAIARSEKSAIAARARWAESLVLLSLGEIERARPLLRAIADGENEYSIEARGVLGELSVK